MLAKRSVTLESTARNRVIRVHLGERLRAYYDSIECTAPSNRLAELTARLAKQLEEHDTKAK